MTTANVNVTKVLLKRGNTAQNNNYTGVSGELTIDTQLKTLRVHDGVTAGGNAITALGAIGSYSNTNTAAYLASQSITSANIGAFQTFANANASSQTTEINSLRSNVTAANAAITSLQSNAATQQTQINLLNANVTAANALIPNLSAVSGNIIPSANVTYSLGSSAYQWKDLWVSNNTIYIGNTPLTVSNGNLLVNGNLVTGSGGSGTDDVLRANVGAYQTFANANAATQATAINTVNANIGGSQTYANTQVNSINANLGAYQTFANSNAATQATSINTFNANLGAYQTFANANAATQATSINTINNTLTSSNVGIGSYAGAEQQGASAVAIGEGSGSLAQGLYSVAIGNDAGAQYQGDRSVAVGAGAGKTNQGDYAVAIGRNAGYIYQGNNTIIINATTGTLNQTRANTFTVAPVRNDVANVAQVMFYNTTSKEVTYGNTISVAGNINASQFNFANGVNILSTVGAGAYGNTQVASYLLNFDGDIEFTSSTAKIGNVDVITVGDHIRSPAYQFSNGVSIFDGITGTYSNTNVAAYLTTGVTTANLTATGNVVQQSAYYETYGNISNTGGNLTCNFNLGTVFYAALTANVTANFTNVNAIASTVTGATIIVDQGATAYRVANVQVNGVNQTIRWVGATIGTGTASNTDIMSFSLIHLGGAAYRVLGQISNYG